MIRDGHKLTNQQFVLVCPFAKQVFSASQPCLLQQAPTQRQHLEVRQGSWRAASEWCPLEERWDEPAQTTNSAVHAHLQL